MPKRRVIDNPEIRSLIERTCYSMYEGCACHQHKEHDGLHTCDSCGAEWTTEDGRKWIEEITKGNDV